MLYYQKNPGMHRQIFDVISFKLTTCVGNIHSAPFRKRATAGGRVTDARAHASDTSVVSHTFPSMAFRVRAPARTVIEIINRIILTKILLFWTL